ncbi:hypothetical protein D915_010904 [Fasciola hepatica]|uniref:Uncharacterized protein n=1 Tax=Fasciola hepatica TaxID=6192 RepID=A0A4E0QY24_FASHE|nr:hypothetical protein D915_010904 [Fasciola hepatica]
MGQIRYWMDDDLTDKSRITVDEITGAVKLVASVPPISFVVTVHAGITSDPGSTHARAIVQVHVTCHFGSDVWDNSQGWAAIHPTSAAELTQFRLREVNDDSMKDESWLPSSTQTPIQLRYEIGLTKFGCVHRSRVSCNATKNVQLESMALWKLGIGLKCPDHPLVEKQPWTDGNLLHLDVGNLCGTGDVDSAVGVSISAAVSGSTTDSIVECITTTYHHPIKHSRIRYLIMPEEDNIDLMRHKRAIGEFQITKLGEIQKSPLNKLINMTFKATFPEDDASHNLTITATCNKCSSKEKAQCTVDILEELNEVLLLQSPYNKTRVFQFDSGQHNQVEAHFTNLNFSDNIIFSCLGICNEDYPLKNVKFTGSFSLQTWQQVLLLPIHHGE